MKVLLIEDDRLIIDPLLRALTEQRYSVDVATDGQAGWDLAESFAYDLILLDIMLPKRDGISICRQLRSQGNATPILLLTAQDGSSSRVLGLDAGADDYVTKPFDLAELLARIRALLRRGGILLPPQLTWQTLTLNPNTCEVTCGDRALRLTPKEYGLLELFLRNRNRIFSCGVLIDHLWSYEEPPTEDTVRSHLKGLRQKLKAAGLQDDPIETVYGIGYRLKAVVTQTERTDGRTDGKTDGKTNGKTKGESDRENGRSQPKTLAASIPESLAESVSKSIPKFIPDVVPELIPSLIPESISGAIVDTVPETISEFISETISDSISELISEPMTGTIADSSSETISEAPSHRISEPPEIDSLEEIARYHPFITLPSRSSGKAVAAANPTPSSAPIPGDAEKTWNIQRIWGQVRDSFSQRVAHLEAATSLLLQGLLAPEQCAEARQEAHRLAGSLGLYGSEEGSSLARAIEPFFESSLANSRQLESHLESQLESHLENHLAERDRPNPARSTPPLTALRQRQLSQLVKALRQELQRLDQSYLFSAADPVMDSESLTVPLSVLRSEEKIMVVDDDPAILAALQALLTPWGLKVYPLTDSRQFWQTLPMADPDLIILDVEMPHLNGIELCQTIRSDDTWKSIPIVFLTAHTDAATMQQVFMAGADDYVSKPIVAPELIIRILNRLERSRLLRNLSETDALTGVSNRRKSTEDLNQILAWSDRHHQPFSLALVDLGQLKRINQKQGHAMGDEVLASLGKLLRQSFGQEDVVGRWGGKTFVMGFFQTTQLEAEQRLAKVIEQFQQIEFHPPTGKPFRVTCQTAVVEYPQAGMDLQKLYWMGDRKLHYK
ncbi:MAG: response regulator [Oculatellaceae cyanobacterium Prado106]|nr:response regulator [Oculatellaceae cyanobacterium Prado106]